MLYGTITLYVPPKTIVDIYVNNKLHTTITPGLGRIPRVPIGSTIKYIQRATFFKPKEVVAEYKVEPKHCVITYTENDEDYEYEGMYL